MQQPVNVAIIATAEKEAAAAEGVRGVAMVPTSALKKRYGDCSDMWIDRRLKSDASFPRPRYIGRRRYWILSELIIWERSLATSKAEGA